MFAEILRRILRAYEMVRISHEVEGKRGGSDCLPLRPLMRTMRFLSNCFHWRSPTVQRTREIKDLKDLSETPKDRWKYSILTLPTLPTPAIVKYHWRRKLIHSFPTYFTTK